MKMPLPFNPCSFTVETSRCRGIIPVETSGYGGINPSEPSGCEGIMPSPFDGGGQGGGDFHPSLCPNRASRLESGAEKRS